MLRMAVLVPLIPLALVGGVGAEWSSVSTGRCSAVAASIRPVAFTRDPLAATVTVQIVEQAELADLAIADDSEVASENRACGLSEIARLVRLAPAPQPGDAVVHLTRNADADYRIYVDSRRISAEQAAALIVNARGGHTRLAARPIDLAPTGTIAR